MSAPRSFLTAFLSFPVFPVLLVVSRPGFAAERSPSAGEVPPRPDDVLTYGLATAYGHTSVVESTNLNSSGNAPITVFEENDSSGGSSTLPVSGWTVQAFEPVTGWLHRS